MSRSTQRRAPTGLAETHHGCLDCRRGWVVIGHEPDTQCVFCGSLDVVVMEDADAA